MSGRYIVCTRSLDLSGSKNIPKKYNRYAQNKHSKNTWPWRIVGLVSSLIMVPGSHYDITITIVDNRDMSQPSFQDVSMLFDLQISIWAVTATNISIWEEFPRLLGVAAPASKHGFSIKTKWLQDYLEVNMGKYLKLSKLFYNFSTIFP
jgi:hypothetical protein